MKEDSELFEGTMGKRQSNNDKPFTSSDPLVGDLANDIENNNPNTVNGVNIDIYDANGDMVTDFDVETVNAVIQVKSGRGTGLTKQMLKSAEYTNKEVIAYGPNLGKHVINSVKAEGFKVFTDKQDLIDYLGAK